MSLPELVRAYVHEHVSTLSSSYSWRIDDDRLFAALGMRVAGADGLARTLDFKRQAASLWATSDKAGRERIAHYCVVVWGGILRTSPASLQRYVAAVETDKPPELTGISSWSKVFAAAHPTRYAIFDARVAASLNALQFMQPPGYVVQLFPMLASRNSTVVQAEPVIRKLATMRETAPVPKGQVYRTYLELLRHAAKGLRVPLPLASAEMLLFAHAESLVVSMQQAS